MITTHVLDTSRGRAAAGVAVTLDRRVEGAWESVGSGETDADGRLRTLLSGTSTLTPGVYRLVFETKRYFGANRVTTFYPEVVIVFEGVFSDFREIVRDLNRPGASIVVGVALDPRRNS